MSETTFGQSPLRSIRKPKCAKCGIEMWLLHIEPQLASDLCTFECARCGTTERAETAPGSGLSKAPSAS